MSSTAIKVVGTVVVSDNVPVGKKAEFFTPDGAFDQHRIFLDSLVNDEGAALRITNALFGGNDFIITV